MTRSKPGPRIAVIGDSVSRVVVTAPSYRWPNLLAAEFGAEGYAPSLWNWGVSGQASVFFAETYLTERITGPFTAVKPDILFVELGTNDLQGFNGGDATLTSARLQTNIGTIITAAQAANASVRVLVCNLVHKMSDAAYDANVAEYNAATVAAAAAGGAIAGDIYNAYGYADRFTHTADFIHPNDTGHAAIAAVLWAAIQAANWHTASYPRLRT